MFLAADTNHSGTVDAKEFHAIVTKFNPEIKIEEVTKEFGQRKEIDIETFKKMVELFLKK